MKKTKPKPKSVAVRAKAAKHRTGLPIAGKPFNLKSEDNLLQNRLNKIAAQLEAVLQKACAESEMFPDQVTIQMHELQQLHSHASGKPMQE